VRKEGAQRLLTAFWTTSRRRSEARAKVLISSQVKNDILQKMILALQYWAGDQEKAFRLARLLADLEDDFRGDVILALVSRFDCVETPKKTIEYCRKKFPCMSKRSEFPGTGYPEGSNQLWRGTMETFGKLFTEKKLSSSAIFTIEPDSTPISRNWISGLMTEHEQTRLVGKQITGVVMNLKHPTPTTCAGCTINDIETKNPVTKTFTKTGPFCGGCHVNGNLIMDPEFWIEHRETLSQTPAFSAWDTYHAATILPHTRPSKKILNEYNSGGWTKERFEKAVEAGGLWLHGFRDDSAYLCARELLT
jgi:hypothetical protein